MIDYLNGGNKMFVQFKNEIKKRVFHHMIYDDDTYEIVSRFFGMMKVREHGKNFYEIVEPEHASGILLCKGHVEPYITSNKG